MIKYNNSNINDWFYNASDIIKVYHNGVVCYYKITSAEPPTPTGSTCYEAINDPITAYTATTYDSVYSFTDSKWYMKNNLNQYEEYGIYDTANTLSDLTYYDGKLAAVGTTEYQYSGGTWVSAGTYVTTEVTYDIPTGYSTTYQGQTMLTTFKISVADMNVLNKNFISIYDNTKTSYYLRIGKTSYIYYGSPRITGTVTSDSDYYYFALTDAKPSIEIYRTRGYNGTVHIITEESTPSVLYQEKDIPLAKAYQSVAAMESEVCPTVGVGQYGVVGSDVYQFDSTELWVTAGGHYKVFEKNSSGEVNVIGCNSNSELTSGDTKPSYFDYSGITEAIIGDCTTTIGTRAFNQCYSLSSVTIPNSVTYIGNDAFRGCSGLTSINIPSGVTTIGNYAFYQCYSLTSCTIGSGVTSIGNYAFQGCSGLTEVEIPDSVTSIGGYGVFSGCTSLTSCTIGSGVTSIGVSAFTNCSNLTSIVIPDSVVSIADNAFSGCTSLPVENNIRYADTYVIETIDKTLTTYTIKSNSRFINNNIFSGCTALTSVTIPDSVVSIGENAFYGCTNLTSVILPSGLTSIGKYFFYNCYSLTSVNIPSGVTYIGYAAFTSCHSLTSVNIPSGVTYIGEFAFEACRILTSVTIPDSVTSIERYSFDCCYILPSVTIPSGVTSIGESAFACCSGLTSFTCLATTPPTLGSNVFRKASNCPIYVPSASVNTYKSASGWSTYASRIQAIPNS